MEWFEQEWDDSVTIFEFPNCQSSDNVSPDLLEFELPDGETEKLFSFSDINAEGKNDFG